MKIKDLLNVEKAIAVKTVQLEQAKKELERLRQEAEQLKLITDINSNRYRSEDLIDVNNMYLFRDKASNITHFAKKIECEPLNYKFVDIYTGERLTYLNSLELIGAKRDSDRTYYCEAISEVFPVTRIYLDGRVPKVLIQKLYYEVNDIDNKVLKIGVMNA